MEGIFVLGSGGFAKEVYAHIKQIGRHDILGFVGIERQADIVVGKRPVPVLMEDDLERYIGKASLAMGIGDPGLLQKLADKFMKVFEFPNLIHPSVVGDFEDISLGVGNILAANCVLTTSIKIGNFNIFNLRCTVGHDTFIGSYNVINPAVNISGGVHIGDMNLIGVNSTILQYKHVGNHTVVGASSLVTRNVADDTTVVGIPAMIFSKTGDGR